MTTTLSPSDAGAVVGEAPLSGVTVIDLSHVYNGPYATFLMALAGAEVIKVEPHTGEHLRSRGDMGGAALPFAMLNSNKKPITLDLKSEQGKEILRKLVKKADILVENFAPGVMERLGLGSAALRQINPRLIYGSSSGYGKDGPYRNYPAMDLVMQAMSGVINSTGHPDHPPVKSGAALCDFFAGIHLYSAIMTALFARERTGRGQTVEVSMQDATYCSLASNYGMLNARGDAAPERTGNRHGGLGVSPYNAYPTKDGYVVVNSPGDRHFNAILDVIGRPELKEDPRLNSRGARVQNFQLVDELLETWTRDRTKNEVADQMLKAGVPCAPVRNLREVMNDENMHARGSLQWVDHPELGRVVLPHTPLNFEGVPRRPLEPSLPLGASNEEVIVGMLGYSKEEFDRLVQQKIV
ncbi:CaiB/BaiF CoA transferase family protein [Paracoccus denitrificans]|jgi:formyl-CoA transferase|uniref:L-carnitine dehydratase/bile acid-inducible protein F n=1 Tax=Paracoccus denitrificans (strain Pd 1222) TaxID=318586 RepID=A1B714_PARDP|nr:CoA transferase [Paracoccus denitrificans]ABL71308.1 L-carnitine dehydratase/bile acid-inducible protein F [Paracoccus denitrificans PD1222]MBB4629601.1 formyl-CoA transferase [Paracoccus denitrificans]MCU7430997.1 CoA transferase [Paracoccus denitrificans]QAR27938.1 CoA transferase [Paracoccus denitrificans]UPV97652.1 CoA transferase [Paracoccus denitrificans]